MGCLGSNTKSGAVGEILDKLDKNWELIQQQFNSQQLEDEKKGIIKERHDALQKELNDKNDNENKLSIVKTYNGKELDVDNRLIKNQNEKMKKLFDCALELAKELKEKMKKELEEKIGKAPSMTVNALKSQLNEMVGLNPFDFLNSDFGKPLKSALEKKGLSKAAMDGYKETLKVQRKERRLVERGEFAIDQNEFPEEEVKKVNEYWNNKEKLSQNINDCINIENAIEKISNINDKIELCKNKKNFEVKLKYNEEQFENYLKEMKKFGYVMMKKIYKKTK